METDHKTYVRFLINLMNNQSFIDLYKDYFKVNLYLTLLTLSNKEYNDNIHYREITIMDDFLRKVNNLKVKIQLKRKTQEIDKLSSEIKEIYEQNTNIVNTYNIDKLNIIKTIESKEPKEITTVIDKLTKEKQNKEQKRSNYKETRKIITETIFQDKYQIKDNNLYINDLTVSLNDFYQIFDYLLDIDNYNRIFPFEKANNNNVELIKLIIEFIQKDKTYDIKVIIPVILTYLINKEILNYNTIDMSKFKIENIKISDLYSLAEYHNENNKNSLKWRNIIIPSKYLYNRIINITSKGMYYFQNENFIIENIIGNTSDFKLSISINDMKNFLNETLTNIKH